MEEKVLKFFTQSDTAWEAMLEACEKATVSIDMEQYIFTNDSIGKRFLEIFIKKRKEGVAIRLLCDTVGSYYFYNSIVPEELQILGIEIRFFNIIDPWRIGNFFSWYFRDHRKILVVDGMVGIIGGVGIREDMAFWRDTCVQMNGEGAQEMQHTFNDMWRLSARKNIFERIKQSRIVTKSKYVVTNAPYPRRRFLYRQLINTIRGAKKSVLLTTPYFVPNPHLVWALKFVAKRGVDVRIIVPHTSDNILVNRASHSFFFDLLSSSIRIYEYSGNFIHTKTAIVDGRWCTFGSLNFDNLSFTYNHEANIISTNNIFVNTLTEHFENDLEKCNEVHIDDWIKRPFSWKFREFLILPFRRFL